MNARTLIPLDRILQETNHITRRHTAFLFSKSVPIGPETIIFVSIGYTNSARAVITCKNYRYILNSPLDNTIFL